MEIGGGGGKMSALLASWESNHQRVKELPTLNKVYLYLTPSVTLRYTQKYKQHKPAVFKLKLPYRKCFRTRFVKKDSSSILYFMIIKICIILFLEGGGIIFSKLTHAQPNSLLAFNFRRLHISSKKVRNINCNNSVKMCDLRG